LQQLLQRGNRKRRRLEKKKEIGEREEKREPQRLGKEQKQKQTINLNERF
jgi:hypothetical protein